MNGLQAKKLDKLQAVVLSETFSISI